MQTHYTAFAKIINTPTRNHTQRAEDFPHDMLLIASHSDIDKAGNKAAVAVVTNTGGDLKPEYKQFAHQPHPDIPSGAYAPNGPLAP